jgi:hypothetical protein
MLMTTDLPLCPTVPLNVALVGDLEPKAATRAVPSDH